MKPLLSYFFSSPLPPPAPPLPPPSPHAGALSLRALRESLLAVAISASILVCPIPAPAAGTRVPPELCQEVGEEVRPESVTNEQLVKEAWEIVNDGFLPDAAARPWSPELWEQKKQDLLPSTIKSRSRAHDIIRKMLAVLGDPYSRFLSPSEFSKMAKYDVTGIGINLREVPDGHDSFKLKVLGLVLDGPAHSVGVRQGDELLSVNGSDVRGQSAFDVSSMLQGPKETYVTIEVKHGDCGPTESIKVQRQLIARTPVFYRLEKKENQDTSVGYIHIKEFNALAKKDLH